MNFYMMYINKTSMVRITGSKLRSLIFNRRKYHTSNCSLYFYESKRSGFPVVHDNLPSEKKLSLLEKFRKACRDLKRECTLFAQETREAMRIHKPEVVANENDIVWKFDGTAKSRNEWIVTCDRDYNLGHSIANLDFSPSGSGIFHGILNTSIPKDGKIYQTGFCNITTAKKLRSFMRSTCYDWSDYTHVVLRVRGDGRCYMLNILQRGNMDMTWYNAHHYLLYTRGGPYWQYVQLPLSRFVYGSKGVIQDVQKPLEVNGITNFGITLADKKSGSFRLEIDYIGVRLESRHLEERAYEEYDISKP